MSEQPNISSNFGNVSVNNSNLIVSSSSAIFDVGDNFTVNSLGSNVLVVNGNISCSTLHYDSLDPPISGGGGGGSSNLEDISNNGNVTSNTIQFLNSSTSLVTTGNVGVGNGADVTFARLSVKSDQTSVIAVESTQALSGIGFKSSTTGTNGNNPAFGCTGDDFVIYTGDPAAQAMRIYASGNTVVTGNVTASEFHGDGGFLSNISTPTSITDLDVTDGSSGTFLKTDGAGTFTFSQVPYSDLSGKPTSITDFGIVDGASSNVLTTDGIGNFKFLQMEYSNIANTPSLATVATTGAYGDLTGAPTNVSDFTNDSNFATTSYVTSEISNVVGSAPAALDTLNELAAALNNDSDFAGSVTTSLSTKLSIADAANTYATSASLATVATTGAYSDLTGVPTNVSDFTNDSGFLTSSDVSTVATTGAYSDLTGKPTSITDLDVTDGTSGQFLTTDGAGTFTFATVSGGGGSSNLQQVTDLGNVTSNTVIFNGGLVTGNAASALTATSNTLTIDMGGLSYRTFTCSTSNSIETLTISNDITGSQGMIFLTATANITLNGYTSNLGGSNVTVSYDDITMVNGDKAMIGILSDGTNRYINAAQFPSAGGTVVESSSGGGSTQECLDVYPTSSQTVTSLTRIIFNTERYNSNASVFSLNTSTGEVTVNKTGLFMINYTASTGISSGSARSVSRAEIYINNSAESYTRVFMYNRINGNEENTGSQTIIKQLTSGDIVDIRAQRHSGSDTIISVPDGTGLRILEILS